MAGERGAGPEDGTLARNRGHPTTSPGGTGDSTGFPFWEAVIGSSERLVFDTSLVVWLPVLAAISLIKNGVGETPNIAVWITIARSFPNSPPIPRGSNYQLSLPVGPALAHVFGDYTTAGYAALHLVIALLAMTVMVVGLHRAAGRVGVGVGLVAFFASPLSNVMFTWLGQQDPFTIGFAAAAALFESPIVLLLAGAGLGVSHPEVGAPVVLALGALRLLDSERRSAMAALGLIGGFAIGVAGTVAYERHAGGSPGAAVSFVRAAGVSTMARQFVSEIPTWLFTTLGAWWFFLGALGRSFMDRTVAVVMASLAILATLATVVTVDRTRVFALIILPAVLWLCVRAVKVVPLAAVRRATAITFILAVAIPRLIVWGPFTYVTSWHL